MNGNQTAIGADLLIQGIGELATPIGHGALGGAAMAELRVVQDAAVLILGGRIAYAGPGANLAAATSGIAAAELDTIPSIDVRGRAAIPGLVDSHTHFIFAGHRPDEFLWRAKGLPYMEIHKRGGGIRRSMEATRAASLADLVETGERRLWNMLSLGITTVEGKSGYGMDRDTELRQLEAMRELSERVPISIVPTYLGPHSIPPEYEGRPSDYIDFVIHEMLPELRARNAARFCDIFCEQGVFGIEDSRRYLKAAKDLGFGLKMHADEIAAMGGAGLAAELKAASADHLLKISREHITAMGEAGTVATCLPLTAFTLREPYAPARAIIDAGCALALASDFNPGSCYSQSIPLIFALALLYMNMSVEEALTALTLNGAAALGLAQTKGSIQEGKDGDLVILDAPSISFLPYNTGMNLTSLTIRAGEIVFRA